jgi:hypothetical protein
VRVLTLFEEKPCRTFRDASWLQPLSLPPDGTPLCRKSDLKFMASFFQMSLEMVKPETFSFSASLEPEKRFASHACKRVSTA